jgi:tubby and related proteins
MLNKNNNNNNINSSLSLNFSLPQHSKIWLFVTFKEMNRADEKQAFDAMMAEISDSDEEDFRKAPTAYTNNRYENEYGSNRGGNFNNNNNNNNNSSSSGNSNRKQNDFYRADAKGTNFDTTAASSSNKAAAEFSSPRPRASAKMSKEEEDIENFGTSSSQTTAEAQMEQLSVTKRWLVRPVSKGERSSMKCFVERERNGFGMSTTYRCYLEGNEGQPARFMMSAKKKTGKQSSYYLISLDMNPSDDRGSETVLGKIRGNTVGSRYIITDHGIAPEKTAAPSMFRKEYAVVGFEFDSGGPSRIDAWIPAVSPSGVAAIFQPQSDLDGMESKIDEHNTSQRILYLQNKQPKWDEAHGGHVLNFQGRVTESSVKNFQLCSAEVDDPEDVLLQFGRVGKHKFNMDLKFPMSPVQAFGICVACMDGKIADRKGYEVIKKLAATGSQLAATGSHLAATGSQYIW